MGVGQSKSHSYWNSIWGLSHSPGYDYDIPLDMYEQVPSSSTGILGSTGSSNSLSDSMGSINVFSGSSNSSSAPMSIPIGGRRGKNTRKAKKVNRKNTRKNRK